jgi:hypothetical protein
MQFAFRKHHGCDDAAHALVNEICFQKNKKKNLVAATFFDFSKAFDTVPHRRLLVKLEKLGVTGNPLKLIKNYLSDRLVFTEIDGVRSNLSKISRGIPQGGALSSTLFNVYTSDIRDIKFNGKLTLFADDSSIINNARSSALLKITVERDIFVFSQWSAKNELSLNCEKTMILLIGKSPQQISFSLHMDACQNHLDCLCPQIQIKKKCKYLGIIIDDTLSFQFHVDRLVAKLRGAIAALFKLSIYNNPEISLKFYHACMQSHIDYGLSIWGNVSKARSNRILVLQKHALRLIYGQNRLSHSAPLFILSNIMPFNQRFAYRACLTTYKMKQKGDLITSLNSTRHGINGKLTLPAQHCRMYSRSIIVTSIRLYNWCGSALFEKKISKFKTDLKIRINELSAIENGVSKLVDGCWNV